jgi:hypothetical protein
VSAVRLQSERGAYTVRTSIGLQEDVINSGGLKESHEREVWAEARMLLAKKRSCKRVRKYVGQGGERGCMKNATPMAKAPE